MNLKRDYKSFDFVLLILVCIAILYSLIILGSISHNLVDVNKTFLKQQITAVVGILILLAAAFIDYHFICKFYIPIYFVNLALSIAVFAIPNEASLNTNTTRWINVFGFSLQPSEFTKIFMLIFLAVLIDKKKETINEFKTLLMIISLTLIPFFLVLRQPALSASLVLMMLFVTIIFNAGISYKYVLAAMALIIPTISLVFYELISGKKMLLNFLIEKNIIESYQLNRIKLFIEKNPEVDEYVQTFNSVNAIGSGGLFGKGLYNGTVTKYGYISNNENDFIMSAIGEELGFVGCIIAIALLMLIIIKCLLIAKKANTTLGKFLIMGVVGILAFQVFANVAVATDLIPNTGMPFPFISSGGSSLMVNMAMIGLVINVGMEKTKSIFEG